MLVQRVAQIFGVVFLLVGLLGLVSSGGLTMRGGLLLGLFPVNVLHNLVHLAFGVWGLIAGRSVDGARQYCQVSGVIYLVLTLLGFVSPTTFGLIPIGSHDLWLHAVLGCVLVIVGFGLARTPARA